MRRAAGVITLGMLMALFCLAIGGLCGCTSCFEHAEVLETQPEKAAPVKCKRVIGCDACDTQVWFCRDYEHDVCFYYSRNGGFLETECDDPWTAR